MGDAYLCRFGENVERQELCYAHLVYVCVAAERLVDVLQVGAASGEYDASEELVGVFCGYQIPHVRDDFEHSCLHYINEEAAVYRAIVVDSPHHAVVDVCHFGVCRSVFQLHCLGFSLFHL